jgi:HD-GYP domain-containing protein (c-di-GMP phosphodiesterase class II)
VTFSEPRDQRRSFWETERIIDPSALQIGHYVVSLDIPWINTPFPLQGVRVESSKVRRWFMDHCQWVVIDVSKSDCKVEPESLANGRGQGATRAGLETNPEHPINSLRGQRIDAESVGSALKAYSLLDGQARQLIKRFTDRGPAEVKAAERVVGELSDYLQRNLAAMVWLTRIKDRHDYTAKHSINCAILALGLAHALEWPAARIERAGLAGLLHDVGNVAVNRELLDRPGPLNEDEMEQVRAHTFIGYELLQEESSVNPEVARSALSHHERLDGSGYPSGLKGEDIDEVSRLTAIVDVYDAITSERGHRPARSHHDALGTLWQGRERHFDKSMVETFIHFMGWVAPGTLVRLSNDELAIVEETNIGQGFYPIVRLLVEGPLGYQADQRLDLAEIRDDAVRPTLQIKEVLPDGASGVKVKSMLVAALEGRE